MERMPRRSVHRCIGVGRHRRLRDLLRVEAEELLDRCGEQRRQQMLVHEQRSVRERQVQVVVGVHREQWQRG